MTAVGYNAGLSHTTGNSSTFIGTDSGKLTTTGVGNTFVGDGSGRQNTTGANMTAVGQSALLANTTGYDNTAVGVNALTAVTTGYSNTAFGKSAGSLITTGAANTILGRYDGNQGGLDIRTASNNIVLSDGAGNPRLRIDSSGYIFSPSTYGLTTGAAANMFIATDGSFQRSTSSLRYKNTVNDATHGLTELLALRPVTYKGNNDGDTVFGGLIAEEVHDVGLTEFVQYNDEGQPDALAYSNMVSLCIKAIQEQTALITALTARITTLEG
jgi:hypothetical protein